jgi:tetratricopeptide (TPR) repeat protein
MIKSLIILAFHFGIAILFTFTGFAQDERIKVAQAYEQSGDYRNSARLWQELYSANPNSEQYFNGIVRSFKAMNNYSGLTDIVKQRLEKRKTIGLLSLYAQILYKSDKKNEAIDTWREAIKLAPTNIETYKEVASSQIEMRLVEPTIQTFEQARSQFNTRLIFADELAQLYAAKGDFKNGLQEVLTVFEASKNLQGAQGRISALMVSDSAVKYISNTIEQVATTNETNLSYQKLYSWFLREVKQYDKSLDIVLRIDKLTRAEGREVLAFADQARNEGQYDVAVKAYSYIIDLSRSNPYSQFAYYGYARSLESKLSRNSDISRKDIEDIISRYRTLIKEYPNTNIAAEALYHIGIMYEDYLDETDQAIKEFKTLLQSYSNYPSSAEGCIELGDCYLNNNDLANAEVYYSKALNEYSLRFPNYRDHALFKRGELYFFTASLDSALMMYNQIEQKPESEFANDAIERSTTISLNRDDSITLRSYSKGLLALKQRKYNEAVTLLEPVINSKSSSDLAESSLLILADEQIKRKEYDKARNSLQQVLIKNPQTIYGDKILLMVATTYIETKNSSEAIKTLQELLASFPRSIYIQEAREKIRKLRGDT